MYTRQIQPQVSSPVQDGNPLTGTWIGAFDKVDLLEIKRPFAWPLPRWARDNRIKEWHSFTAESEDIFLEAVFCNFKLYKIAQVSVYNKQNENLMFNEKYFYKKVIYGAGWVLPGSLSNTSIEYHSFDLNFHIHSCLAEEKIKLELDIAASRRRPSLTVNLEYNVTDRISPMAVSLGITERRTMYAYKTIAPVLGEINFAGQNFILKQEACSGFFCDYKGFFAYRTKIVLCSAMGFKGGSAASAGRARFGFHIVENKTREPNKNNENALWVDGELTPLPPVLITMPYGPEGFWIIQDVEGMIDLKFTLKDQNKSIIKMAFTNADLNAQIGYYNGIILTKEGEQIQIRNLLGIGEKIIIRV